MSLSSVNLTTVDRRELPPIEVDEDDPERTHSVWLYVQAPPWRQLLRQQQIRRYFVFSGANVSCFSVNKEGKSARLMCTIATKASSWSVATRNCDSAAPMTDEMLWLKQQNTVREL
ncbi:hypothetical protein V7S43_011395 [Phytophthora oleae]|uniref:Uncharacterized protein n=1 Tax=Phytophthora oleae TaxID=2107226 RepID=A0ABD3FAN5_9STRA